MRLLKGPLYRVVLTAKTVEYISTVTEVTSAVSLVSSVLPFRTCECNVREKVRRDAVGKHLKENGFIIQSIRA